jgi:hypothetical protein
LGSVGDVIDDNDGLGSERGQSGAEDESVFHTELS